MNLQRYDPRGAVPDVRGFFDGNDMRNAFTVFRRMCPSLAWALFAVMVAAQALAYWATRLVLPHLTAHLLSSALDARIPFSPPWIAVYCLSFPFWAVSGLWILSGERRFSCRFAAAYILAMFLSAAVFLLYPCTMERPEVTGSGFFPAWVRLIYSADSPTNLLPSLHVLITYFCGRGAFGSTAVPKWYGWISAVFFLLVCCSVVLVKQHVLVDIPAGIAAGELALQCARLLRMERLLSPLEKRIARSDP